MIEENVIIKPVLPAEQVIMETKIRLLDYPEYISDSYAVKLEDMKWRTDLSELIRKKYLRQVKNNKYRGTLILVDDNFKKLATYLNEKIKNKIYLKYCKLI